MANKEERERRVGRKLFNDGIATDEEHEYTCDRCGQVERTTSNYDGFRHSLPLPACNGIFHAELRTFRMRAAAEEMLELCNEILKTEQWDLPRSTEGRWIKELAAWARKIVDKVEGPAKKEAAPR